MTSPRLQSELLDLKQLAQPVCEAAGVPWAVCVAQAWTESGLGRSELARKANNFHGIKYRKRVHPRFVWHISPEQTRKGLTTRNRMRFAAFDTPQEGIQAWCDKVTGARYSGSSAFRDDPVRFMAYLWGRGWATAGHYVEHVAGRLRALGEAIGDTELAQVHVDTELEPCLEVLREAFGAERHKATEAMAEAGFCWSRVPAIDFAHELLDA